MNDAYDVRLKHWRLARLKKQPGFTFHRLDITDREALHRLFEARADGTSRSAEISTAVHKQSLAPPFEAIINLAARAGVRQSVKDPWIYFQTNTTGTLNLLEICRDFGVKKFVTASTSSLYGAHNPRPFREDADTDSPLSPYAASKKAAEVLCYTYHYLYDIDVTVLRYFTVYGPAGRPNMSLFRFVQWITERRPVVVFGDGQQSRDFTYVDDITRGTLAALRPLGYEIINLGSDTPVVLMDAVQLVEKLVGRKANLIFKPRHVSDVPATWADISKAQRLLSWSPQYGFEEGLRNLVNWYNDNIEWARHIETDRF